LPGALEPVGQYKKIYDQFLVEQDFDRAMSLAKRLQKGNLLYWLNEKYHDIAADIEPNIKKPELMEWVENVLTSTLKNAPEAEPFESNPGDESKAEPLKEEQEPTKEEPQSLYQQYPNEWDNSGPIQKDQLRELVRIKSALEQARILSPDKWSVHVRYFQDANKNPIDTAKNLTAKQGATFIAMLSKNLPADKYNDQKTAA